MSITHIHTKAREKASSNTLSLKKMNEDLVKGKSPTPTLQGGWRVKK